jgi:transcriptional regulator with XRE-family HTH domain
MNISDKIKAVRRAKGITPTIMAKELGIEATNYPRLENRGNQLTYANLEKISKALGISVIELLTWEDNVTPVDTQPIQESKTLAKRVLELEKWLQDKDARNEASEQNIRSLKDKINTILNTAIHEYALANFLTTDMFEVVVRTQKGKIEKHWVTNEELEVWSEYDDKTIRDTFKGMKVIEVIMGYQFDDQVSYDAIRDLIQKFEGHPFDQILYDILFQYCDDKDLVEILKPFKEARRLQIEYWKNWPIGESRTDKTNQGESNP